MIKQAAVWIVLFCCVVPAMIDDVIDVGRKAAADACAKLGRGRDKCLTT